MFHFLSNIQDSAAVALQQCINNQQGELYVGLRQITYTVGWYNVRSLQSFSWRSSGSTETAGTLYISPGLYSFPRLWDRIRRAKVNVSLRFNPIDGMVTVRVPQGWDVQFTDGLLSLLGLDDGLHGEWLDSGTYTSDHVANFAGTKALQVYLDQLSTTGNFADGAPSTMLATVGLGRYFFGETITSRFERPEFKCLRNGNISELNIRIEDEDGEIIDNHDQPISVVLEFRSVVE